MRVQPVPAGCALPGGQDLDLLAIAELVGQGHDAAIDLGAAATVSDIGVYGIGEIQWRRALRQIDNAALRRQCIDPLLEGF